MVDVVTPARSGTSYVEWGAVFAGALAASAISFVLLTAGAAIGLSLVSPYEFKVLRQACRFVPFMAWRPHQTARNRAAPDRDAPGPPPTSPSNAR